MSLAIVQAYTMCFEVKDSGKELRIRSATEKILAPSDIVFLLEDRTYDTLNEDHKKEFKFPLVKAMCRHGIVSLNPYALKIFSDDETICSFDTKKVY